MKQVKIGFSKSSLSFAPFSWLIMWASGAPYSHAYLKTFVAGLNANMVFQASHDLVNFMHEDIFNAQETIYKEFSLSVSDDAFDAINGECAAMAGLPYDVVGILGCAYMYIVTWMGFKNVRNPLPTHNQSYYCSKVIAQVMQDHMGVVFSEPIDDITPDRLFPYVEALAAKQTS